jgi:hypothetical protein
MSPDTSQAAPPTAHAAIDHAILDARERSPLQGLVASQAFWVTVALAVICVIMGV